ncbi:hypothetical protein CR513_03872, partial [Mucuna pruriens]
MSIFGYFLRAMHHQQFSFQHLGGYEAHVPREVLPASKTMTIRKEIYGIRQYSRETLHEYWERLNKLCATSPHHQISEKFLIQYFYQDLMMMDRSMIDATSGGAVMDKTLVAARHLISNMACNMQQFGTRGATTSQMVNEVGAIHNLTLGNQLTELTSLVRQLAIDQHQSSAVVRVCGIWTSMEHPTDMCPTLQETDTTVRTVATTESAITMQLTISGPNKAVDNKQLGLSA